MKKSVIAEAASATVTVEANRITAITSAIAFSAHEGEAEIGKFDGYDPLVAEIVTFFKTKKPPVAAEETIELFAFMEAADESKRRGGAEVKLAEVLAKAKGE